MTTAQKIIKYLALSFAIFLIFTIMSGIFETLYSLSGLLGLQKEDKVIKNEMNIINFENNSGALLDIDVSFTNLIIKKGEFLKAETNNKNINCKQNNQNLQIKEKKHNWFSKNNKGDLIIYIPEDLNFEKVKINAGAGKIQIENINAKKLYLDLGAGETVIEKLNITDNCKIESGAGKVSILSGNINELNLDMGVGKVSINSKLTGNSKIDAGVGNLKIDLLNKIDDYYIDISKGLGSISLNGEDLSEGTYGSGSNKINIDGGIGNIDITTIGR